ncbi:MAG: FCD domain-containing protein, partial [Mesorhizobium sp.]
DQIAALERALDVLLEAWASANPIEVMRATTKFYEVLFDAADKRIAWEIVQGLNVRINQLRSMTIASVDRRDAAIAEMTDIMNAIKSRNGELRNRPFATAEAETATLRNRPSPSH